MKLRPYQQKSIDKVITSDATRIVITLPTGAGKSIVIQKLVEHYHSIGKTVAVVVNKSALIPQLKSNLMATGLNVGVIKSGQHVDVNEPDAVLIMEQSFNEMYTLTSDVLIRDEIHDGFKGIRFANMVERLNPEILIGLTATPIDEKGIYLFNENTVYIEEATTASLIEQEYLVQPCYVVPKYSELMDYSKIARSGADYSTSALEMMLNTPEHNDFVVDNIVENIGDRPTMVFASSIAHAKAINEELIARGITSGVVHSKDENNSEATIRAFKTGKLQVIVNMSKLTTGFDHPPTSMIVLVRPTKVLRLYLQIVGRGLRISEGKTDCLILDMSKSLSTHGMPDANRNYKKTSMECVNAEAELLAEDGVIDMDGTIITRQKLLEYNLNVKIKRVDQLIQQVNILSIQLKDEKRYSSELLDRIDEYEEDHKKLFNTATEPKQMLFAANSIMQENDLPGKATQKTIYAIVDNFNAADKLSHKHKMAVLKQALKKIVNSENGTWPDGSYKGIASLKTRFTWLQSKQNEPVSTGFVFRDPDD